MTNLALLKQQTVSLCQQGAFLDAKNLLEDFEKTSALDAESYAMFGSINGQLNNLEEAVRCFDRSIQLRPEVVQPRFGLGRVLSQLGKYEEAAEHFSKAVQLNPEFVQAGLELSIVQFTLANYKDAEKGFINVLHKEPGSIKALMGLGRIYHIQNKPEMAAGYFDNVIEIDSSIAEAHYHRGSVLFSLGEVEKAEECYLEAIRLKPSLIQAHVELGQLYLATNKIELAKESYNNAIGLQPDNLNAIAGEAKLLEQSGDMQGVYDRIMPHIEKGVLHADIGIMYSKICKHFDCCDEALRYIETLLEHPGKINTKNSRLYFALGKIYDQLGQYDKAFDNYDKGNRIKPDRFNAQEHKASVDKLIKTLNWDYFIKSQISTQKSDRYIFIVGMPRSGSTLTEQILCSHPDVFGAGEIVAFPNIIRKLSTYFGTSSVYPDSLVGLVPGILDKMAADYITYINTLNESSLRIVDKTLVNYLYLGLISQVLPEARIIHCKRDPIDTCLSIYFQNFDESHDYATRLENLGFYYKEYERVMNHWKSLIKIPVYEVQYEELVNNQEKISRELIDFIGLDWDERVLEFYKSKRSVVTASYDQVRQKMYTKSTQRWKNYEKHIDPLIKALPK